MIGIQWYHETIRTAVSVFGGLFNNIVIQRRDGKVVAVPIAYSPRVKWLDAQGQFNQSVESFENLLPRMGYELKSMKYDTNRKLNNKQSVIGESPLLGGRSPRINAPVPYSLTFALYIQTKNLNDGWQIIEQILPFFQPAYTVRVRNFPDEPQFGGAKPTAFVQPINEFDMPFTLSNIEWEDDYQGEIQTRRDVQWTLTFETKVNLWGPIVPTTIIYDARVGIYVADTNASLGTDTQLNTIVEAGYYNQLALDLKLPGTTDYKQLWAVQYSSPYHDSELYVIPSGVLPDPADSELTLPSQVVQCRPGTTEPCVAYIKRDGVIDRNYFLDFVRPSDSETLIYDSDAIRGIGLVRFFKYNPDIAPGDQYLVHPPIGDVAVDSETGGVVRVVRPVIV